MTLSARQFSKLMRDLNREEEAQDVVPGHNNRRSPRIALQNRATIIPHLEGTMKQAVGVEVRDFSARGIRFLHSARLPRGTQFILALPQQAGDPVQILCTVAHCRVTSEGPFSVGAEFTCVLKKQEKASDSARGTPNKSERDRIRQSILN